MKAWYAVYSQPGKETLAAVNLRRQDFEVYLPQLRKKRSHARRIEWIAAPLFQRYLFVAMDVETARWRSIQATIGVSYLVCFGERPLQVPTLIIDALKGRENEKGYVDVAPIASVIKGDMVRILDGAMADCVGVIEHLDDRDRVTMLLDLMGQQVKVQTPLRSVATVG